MLTIVAETRRAEDSRANTPKPPVIAMICMTEMSIDPALVKINLSLLVLFESIVNRRIFADRTFEFEYNQR
jgi:hypothetical protein